MDTTVYNIVYYYHAYNILYIYIYISYINFCALSPWQDALPAFPASLRMSSRRTFWQIAKTSCGLGQLGQSMFSQPRWRIFQMLWVVSFLLFKQDRPVTHRLSRRTSPAAWRDSDLTLRKGRRIRSPGQIEETWIFWKGALKPQDIRPNLGFELHSSHDWRLW